MDKDEEDIKVKTDRAKRVLEGTENDVEILNKVEVQGGDDPIFWSPPAALFRQWDG